MVFCTLKQEKERNKSMRILVVDDEPAVREVTRGSLEGLGHEVVTAADGKIAIELLQAESFNFDGIFTDLEMPNMSGIELLNEVRHRVKFNLPVFCITGQSAPADLEHLRTLGFAAVLPKPYRRDDLKAMLNSIPAA
ncbi:MAG: hypothetical protein A2951_02215 [Candidatus Buchananbacteria bacterium RIFCSPLOWO2_01_FULL_56_15]|uniref:Response regulatory domain-containing protein n=2 Tax=Candidatus Buchananiibacteriota TaxID=1817903 RepID=A0A1G1YCC5_9BACT|nr:MAG: hypothetical protein A3J59_00050 [Candidatus Buchananbacteria bacterium RIFCSPHIGHO2_02_FULL_56_16]OGY54782.1 MAG: hypothetical protein A2951_02215 [Candidatus Buchananbacteria bacterium RIFCSPLOWO2_01_FULL_56_15]